MTTEATPGLNKKSLGKPTDVTTEATPGLNKKSLGKPTEVTTEATPGRNREAVKIVQSGLLTIADRDYGQHNILPRQIGYRVRQTDRHVSSRLLAIEMSNAGQKMSNDTCTGLLVNLAAQGLVRNAGTGEQGAAGDWVPTNSDLLPIE